MKQPVILSAARTPVGRFGGSMRTVTDHDMSVLVIKEAIARAGLTPDQVEELIFAQQYRTGVMPPNIARPISVDAGMLIEAPSFSVAKACGGSIKTVALAAQAIKAGDFDLLVSGGVEHMSGAAYLVPTNRWGARLGHAQLMDQLVLYDPLSKNTMGETAENVAEKYQVNREDQDDFALLSQQKAGKALENGVFKDQIVPVPIPQRKGDPKVFDTDEHPRPQTTREQLASLKPVFRKGGSVTAGNSSGMNDGAGALVVASDERAAELGLKPLVSIAGYASVGVDPAVMGIGPVYATRKLMQQTGLSVDDLDVIELNEAFASQSLACIRELNLDIDKVNPNGGAIALGHPISGTGAVILTKLIYEMKRADHELGLATMCVGGGLGVAILLKNLA